MIFRSTGNEGGQPASVGVVVEVYRYARDIGKTLKVGVAIAALGYGADQHP